MPYFSVIIPVYNKEKFIENTIKSVLQQSFSDFELILVNDGSTDDSESKILSFDDHRIRYHSKKNEGVSTARNFGVEKAQADYITFLDADDYWYPDFLEAMFFAIKQFPLHSVFSAAIEVETKGTVFPAQYSIVKKDNWQVVNYFDASIKTTAICTSCAVFHKSVFQSVGLFDPNLKSGQDTDLWIRIGLIYPIVFSFKILSRYVYDPQSLSKNKTYANQKLDFSKFADEEKYNASLKRFLDLNRYSFALRSKLRNDYINYSQFKKAIDQKNLSPQKKILLHLPSAILRILLQVNLVLVQLKLSQSVFKE